MEDTKLLNSLALALVDHPRASLEELARQVGISKATLYRFCRTREQLITRLSTYAIQAISGSIKTAQLDSTHPLDALKRLISNYLEHREPSVFLTYFWNDAFTAYSYEESPEISTLDAFFLRGQKEGVFRIDIPAPALTDLWISIMVGLVDAERRGRVAKASLATLMETAFLDGARAK